MKQHPILFSTPMVQAILEGRKTQTRRIVKPQPDENGVTFMPVAPCLDWEQIYNDIWTPWLWDTEQGERIHKECPYGQVGDVLWVRETWRKYQTFDDNGSLNGEDIVEFAADKPRMLVMSDGDGFQMYNKDGSEKYIPWKPSIFMPRAACRIFLGITDIRVERLQDISVRDVFAEGAGREVRQMSLYGADAKRQQEIYAGSYSRLWVSINGEQSWKDNPWVWVISFKRIGKPESSIIKPT